MPKSPEEAASYIDEAAAMRAAWEDVSSGNANKSPFLSEDIEDIEGKEKTPDAENVFESILFDEILGNEDLVDSILNITQEEIDEIENERFRAMAQYIKNMLSADFDDIEAIKNQNLRDFVRRLRIKEQERRGNRRIDQTPPEDLPTGAPGDAGIELENDPEPEKNEIRGVASAKFNEAFRLSREDLLSIPGFGALSEGKQVLLFQNLASLVVRDIKTEAGAEKEKENRELFARDRMSNMLVRAIKSFGPKRVRDRMVRFQELEKEEYASKLSPENKEEFKGLLQSLVPLAESAPEAHYKNGSLSVDFLSQGDVEGLSRKRLAAFNGAAEKLSKIPREWGFLGTKLRFAEKLKKWQVERAYAKERAAILAEFENHFGAEEVAQKIISIDERIALMRHFNTHPEAEKELQNIKNEKIWKRAGREILRSREAFFAYGALSRLVAAGTAGVFAPFAAGYAGYKIGEGTAEKAIEARKERGRAGEDARESIQYETKDGVKKERTIREFTSASFLAKRLARFRAEIEELSDGDEHNNQREMLMKKYAETAELAGEKERRGLIDYVTVAKRNTDGGITHDNTRKDFRIVNTLDFFEELGHARAILREYNTGEIKNNLDRALEIHGARIEAPRRREVMAHARRAALLRAGFAGAGWLAADYFASESADGSMRTIQKDVPPSVVPEINIFEPVGDRIKLDILVENIETPDQANEFLVSQADPAIERFRNSFFGERETKWNGPSLRPYAAGLNRLRISIGIVGEKTGVPVGAYFERIEEIEDRIKELHAEIAEERMARKKIPISEAAPRAQETSEVVIEGE
ncbi:hypothetical protein L0Y41_02830 [bacterium]|nr:hypothetical protein [bacterium]